MSDTPRTDALIAHLDLEPESRLVFVIRQIVNHAKQLERDLRESTDIALALSGYLDPDAPDAWVRGQEEKLRALAKGPEQLPQPEGDK